MITKTLKDFASPIIENAMATGGRSSTTTVTDYSGIRDALNANSELQMKVTQFKYQAGTHLNEVKANNNLQILDIKQNWMRERDAIYEKAAASHMGDFEKALGTLQGAASGAMAGYAVGGPWGAAIGGVAGGVASGSEYYSGQDDARERGQRSNQMLGGIATTAVALRGMYDHYKGKEVASKGMKELGKMREGLEAMSPTDREAAVARYEGKMASINAELSKYYGPDEVANVMDSIRKGNHGVVSADPVERARANLAANSLAAAADPELMVNGPRAREVLKGYHAANNRELGTIYGYDGQHGMGNQDFVNWAGSVSPELGRSAQEVYGGSGIAARSTTSRSNGINAMSPASSGGQAANQPVNPTRGTPTQQPAPQQSMPVAPNNFVQTPPVGIAAPGVSMDDGMGFMRDPIHELTDIGSQSAKILADNERKQSLMPGEQGGVPDSARDIMAQNMGDRPTSDTAPMKEQPESDAVKKWRSGDSDNDMNSAAMGQLKTESKELDQQIDANISEAEKHNFMNTDGLKKAEALINSKEGLKKMENLVGKVPNDSQVKAMASKVYLEGLRMGKTGQALGATIGMSGGVAGVLAGNVIGDTLGEVLNEAEVGKGSKTVAALLTPSERKAIDEYYRVSSLLVPQMVKTSDGNMVTNPEAKEMSNNFFNYGQTAEAQQSVINTLKKDLLTKSGTQSRLAKAGQAQYEYREQTPIRMRAQYDIGKAEQMGYERQRGSEAAKMESEAMKRQVRGGYIDW